MHCYSTYFLQLLLGVVTVLTYNYTAVDNWSANIDGASSVFNLHKLYIPTNKHGVHWLLLRFRMAEKSIKLSDSLGHDKINEVYLQLAWRYLYNAHNHNDQRDQIFEEWILDWSYSDQSNNSPMQGNGHDCGIFILVSLAFLSNTLVGKEIQDPHHGI